MLAAALRRKYALLLKGSTYSPVSKLEGPESLRPLSPDSSPVTVASELAYSGPASERDPSLAAPSIIVSVPDMPAVDPTFWSLNRLVVPAMVRLPLKVLLPLNAADPVKLAFLNG
jgi:hypothetical protein